MFRKLTVFVAALCCALLSVAQGDLPAGATTVTTSFYTLGTPLPASLTGATSSGIADGNVDQFFHFVAGTQGVKVEVIPVGIDVQIDVLNLGEAVLGTENSNGVGGTETMFANFLVPGLEYYVRVSAPAVGAYTVLVEELPEAELRGSFSPNPSADSGLPGYKMGDQTKRNNINTTVYPVNLTSLVQGTMWEITDPSDGTVFIAEVGGANGILVLDDVTNPTNLCYGNTYDVRVQLKLEGKWCGWGPSRPLTTEEYPQVNVLPAYLNTSYLLQPGFLRTNFLGTGQTIEWHLETNLGDPTGPTEIDYATGDNSSYCYFQDVECMRYNKIYSVEVRATYCGLTGPWSDPAAFYTSPLPYTNVRPEFCDTDMYAGDGLFAEFIEGADQYAWQAAPIDPDDPTMTPIGPGLVTTTPNTTLILSSLGVEFGQTYRIGCKPILGTADDCDDWQEGDYGYFCPIHIIDPFGFSAFSGDAGEAPNGPETEQVFADERLEVVSSSTDNILTLSVQDASFDGYTDFVVLDMQGKVVAQTNMVITPEMDRVQFAMRKDLSAGVYIVRATQGEAQLTSKFNIR